MQRRHFLTATAAAFAAPTVITSAKTATPPLIVGHGSHRYRVEREWSKADHSKVPLKDCHEMVQSSDGRLFLITNETKNNILVYATDGTLLDHWTLGMRAAHGLTIDSRDGEEFLYLTCNTGRVVKTDLSGNILLELPQPSAVGAYPGKKQYTPTETAIAPNGDIYVIDGYGSQFVLQFSANGKFIRKFGGRSTLPTSPGKFIQAHGIALDTRGTEPLLVCTGRMRNELSWFTLEGEFRHNVYLPGAYLSRPVIDGDFLHSAVCFGFKPCDYRMWMGRGFITILDAENKVVSCPGGAPPRYEGDRLLPLMKEGGLVNNGHDVCVDSERNLYLCQWNSGQIPPIKLHRID